MDPLPPLPFPPGKSPFHIKGVAVEGFMKFVAARVPGGADAVAARIDDPAIRDYYRQPFLDSIWYDLLPFLHVYPAAASLMGLSTEKFVGEHAAWQVGRDARGVYKLLLLLATPEAVARRMGAAFSRYFDFTTVEVLSVTTGEVVSAVRALPSLLLPWYRASVDAGARTILAMAGARNLEAEYSPPEADGARSGVPLVRFQVRRTWSR